MIDNIIDFNDYLKDDDEEFNEIVRLYKLGAEILESTPTLINKDRVLEIQKISQILQDIAIGENVSVNVKLFAPTKDVGRINVVGKELRFNDTKKLSWCLQQAANFQFNNENNVISLDLFFVDLVDF